jgi:hypothetical protein
MRRDATFLSFDVPVAVEIGPPYPIPPVLFDIMDAEGPTERMGLGLQDVTSLVTGGQVPIAAEGEVSGIDPSPFGEGAQFRALWNGTGMWEDSHFEIPVDVSPMSGVDPSPFLPELPAVQITPTGFLLSFEVWRDDVTGGGGIVTTSRRQIAFDVPGPQGVDLILPCIMPLPGARSGSGYSGFLVEFDAKESGVGMDEAEPVFEATFWGDCAPATATNAPAVAAAGGAAAIAVRPSVTRSGAELLLSRPAGAASTIDLFDVSGRLVRRLDVAPGASAAHWDGGAADGRSVSSGVYFFRFTGQRAGGSARIVVVR